MKDPQLDPQLVDADPGEIPARPGGPAHPPPLLEAMSFTKHFGEVRANTDVDLRIFPGQVHALIGENGAGKSTLLKMIYGVIKPDAGQMLAKGHRVIVDSPAKARALGIGMVFQDLRLVAALTVAENIALAMPGGFRLRSKRIAREIELASAAHGLAVDPAAKVEHLSIGERQRVEILKVLMTGASIVILDEPTSVLAPQEVDSLFAVIDHLRGQGLAIVLVTHKLNEVRAVADRVTVLRGGYVVLAEADPRDYSGEQLVEAMVGRQVPPLAADRQVVPDGAESRLQLAGARAKGGQGHEALRGIDLDVHAGELVGIAGVAGSGQRELCEVALGLRPVTAGEIRIGDARLDGKNARDAIDAGAAAVPEDPVADSVVPGLTVRQHMVLDGNRPPRRGLGIDWKRVAKRTAERDADVGLNIAGQDRLVGELSGGNIQRVVLTRALGGEPEVVVAAYPSRGLDITNTRRTQELLLRLRARGTAVLVVSEDLDELMSISDRIAVMRDGQIAGVVQVSETDRQAVGALMVGSAT